MNILKYLVVIDICFHIGKYIKKKNSKRKEFLIYFSFWNKIILWIKKNKKKNNYFREIDSIKLNIDTILEKRIDDISLDEINEIENKIKIFSNNILENNYDMDDDYFTILNDLSLKDNSV